MVRRPRIPFPAEGEKWDLELVKEYLKKDHEWQVDMKKKDQSFIASCIWALDNFDSSQNAQRLQAKDLEPSILWVFLPSAGGNANSAQQ